jgi:hypothetical protein
MAPKKPNNLLTELFNPQLGAESGIQHRDYGNGLKESKGILDPVRSLNLVYNTDNDPKVAENLKNLHKHRQKVRAKGHKVPYIPGKNYNTSTIYDFNPNLRPNGLLNRWSQAIDPSANQLHIKTFAPLQKHPDGSSLGLIGLGLGGLHVVNNEFGYPNGLSLVNKSMPGDYMRGAAIHEGIPGIGHKGSFHPREAAKRAVPVNQPIDDAIEDRRRNLYAFPRSGTKGAVRTPNRIDEHYLGDLTEYLGFANRTKNFLAGSAGKQNYKNIGHIDPLRSDPGALDGLLKLELLKAEIMPDGTRKFSAGPAHRKHPDHFNGFRILGQPGGSEMSQLSDMLNIYQELDKRIKSGTATDADKTHHKRLNIMFNKGWDEANNKKPTDLVYPGSVWGAEQKTYIG